MTPLLKSGLLVALLGLSIASRSADVNWSETIRVGKSEVFSLIGTVSTEALRAYLGPTGRVAKSVLGRSVVVLSVFQNSDVEGCGCPERFNEFTLVYLLEAPAPQGELPMSPDFQLTNQILRQTSVAFKFGTKVELGSVGFTPDRGFRVADASGVEILDARPAGGMPKVWRSEEIRYGSYSLGGVQSGVKLTPTYSKLQGQVLAGYRPFRKGRDRFKLNPTSRLGRHLGKLKFTPLVWQSMEATSHMWVWLAK